MDEWYGSNLAPSSAVAPMRGRGGKGRSTGRYVIISVEGEIEVESIGEPLSSKIHFEPHYALRAQHSAPGRGVPNFPRSKAGSWLARAQKLEL